MAAVARAGVEDFAPAGGIAGVPIDCTEPFGPGGGIDFAQTGHFCGFGRVRFREPVEPRLIRGTQVLFDAARQSKML